MRASGIVRAMLRWSSLVVVLTACGADGDARCVLGKSESCTCASGESGAQVCDANGRFGACVCGRPDGDGLLFEDGQVSETSDDASASTEPTEVIVADSDVAADVTSDVTDPCPTAVINCVEGYEVAPQTTLHCSASDSTGGTGAIVGYAWQLAQPIGSNEAIRPSATQRDIQLTANVVGTYTLTLDVYDAIGVVSCEPAFYTIIATSDEGILVELLWRTPGDSNETDTGETPGGLSVGSDLDLHLLHPDATGWFDGIYDAHWENPAPNWAGAGSLDDPKLERDDDDGGGPELIRLDQPESNAVYTVGAHYFDDWDYGHALATLRVYIYGQLRFHWDDVRLNEHDMWKALQIAWPSGDVTPVGGSTPDIQPNVVAPVAEP